MDRTSPLEVISTEFGLADGPAWNGWSLIIPDVKQKKIVRYNENKNQFQDLVSDSGRISASFFNHGRAFLSDNEAGAIAFLDGNKKIAVTKFVSESGEKPMRPNDLVVDRSGGVYVTFTPQGKVIYVAKDGKQSTVVDSIKTPNGIILSPDEQHLYVSEFVPKKIKSFRIVKPGVVAEPSEFAAMDDDPTRGADGMTIDRAGNVYCAGPSNIWIWNPNGELLDKIKCPQKPINCVFGGKDMRTLFISGPGGLYRQRMKISGRSPQPPGLKLNPASTVNKNNETIPSTVIPQNIETHLDQVFAIYDGRKLLMDLFMPKDAQAAKPCIVVVHGGGWHNGDKTKFRALAVELAKRGYATAAIEYRLADEAAFPAGIYDCNAAVRFLRSKSEKWGIDPNRIGAIGGSAGGHLVGLMASGGKNPKLQGAGGNPEASAEIQAAIVMAGPMEMLTGSVADRSRNPKAKSNSNSWLRATVDENPALYALADAHAQIDNQTCPILFMVGEHDNPDRNKPSRDKLTMLGIETGVKIYADGKHGCWNRLPWFNLMVEDMDRFFQKQLSPPISSAN